MNVQFPDGATRFVLKFEYLQAALVPREFPLKLKRPRPFGVEAPVRRTLAVLPHQKMSVLLPFAVNNGFVMNGHVATDQRRMGLGYITRFLFVHKTVEQLGEGDIAQAEAFKALADRFSWRSEWITDEVTIWATLENPE